MNLEFGSNHESVVIIKPRRGRPRTSSRVLEVDNLIFSETVTKDNVTKRTKPSPCYKLLTLNTLFLI